MAEILPGSFAPNQATGTPVAVAVPPPGADATARTQRAAPAAQDSQKTEDRRRRTIEDRVEMRDEETFADRRLDSRAADAAAADQAAAEKLQDEDNAREDAVRDRHEVDFRI
jgi:hypothetical protein